MVTASKKDSTQRVKEKTAVRKVHSLCSSTIFAHEIARERQSSFGQKCEPVFVRERTKARFVSCVARPIRKGHQAIYPEGSLWELNSPRSSRASTERPIVEFANRIPRNEVAWCPSDGVVATSKKDSTLWVQEKAATRKVHSPSS